MPDAFISPAELVGYIGRGDQADLGITLAIDAACGICRTTAEQTFSRSYGSTVILDGTGTDALPLPETPVLAAGTVSVDGTTVTDYVVAGEAGLLFRRAAETPYTTLEWPVGRQNVVVVYDHGYELIPPEIKMVALSIAARLVIQGPAIQETVGEDSMRYAVSSTDLTAGEQAILRRYKRSR